MLRFIFFSFLLGWQIKVLAQCPKPATCTPGNIPTTSVPFGLGVFNVVIGNGSTGINHATSGGASAGNQDYSCTQKAIILEGTSTTISITTNPNINENVRVWLDMNNNGALEASTELIFSSNNAKVHNGSFFIPVTPAVVKNTVLRLRVFSDNFSSPIPSPCSTPVYGQVEDYGLTIITNTNKPAVNFSVNKPITCMPSVQFQNLTQNGATSYLWDFGDNSTSTLANPSHTYAGQGTYTVKLKACNATGCDSLTKVNFITYHNNLPVAASCTPITSNYCCGYGITKFTFHTMVNSSSNGIAGYEDFTCSKTVTVEGGQTYPVAIETGFNNIQDSWVFIDYNNNGIFEATEKVFTRLNTYNPAGTITIPLGKTLNTPLRMRVVSDVQGSLATSCLNIGQGQAEDYTIIIKEPQVTIATSTNTSCTGQIQFTGTRAPSVTNWFWDFGDGNFSSVQNPNHNYVSNGVYSVKLKACTPTACDSVVKTDLVIINKPCLTYCTPNVPGANNPLSITKVQFNSINNISGLNPAGYNDFTYLVTDVLKGSYYNLSVNTNNDYLNTGLRNKTIAWIDFNRDGDFFDSGEQVVSNSTHAFKRSVYIPATASTGITRMRVFTLNDSLVVNSCPVNFQQGEIEDYSINIKPVTQKPVTYFSSSVNPCFGLNLFFADSSSNMPISYAWNFGDPASGQFDNTSTLPNPSHYFSAAGNYTVKLKTCNNFGCDSLQVNIAVTTTSVSRPKNNYCTPSNPYTPSTDFGIERVSLNFINHTTSGASDGYQDYTCSQKTTLEQLNPYILTIQTKPSTVVGTNPRFEQVKVWIDYDDDGNFIGDPDELVLSSLQNTSIHTTIITPPLIAVFNKPLRIRVQNIFSFSSSPTPPAVCTIPDYGQVEDYTVTIVPFTDKPLVHFKPDAQISCGSPIQFTDSSAFFPTSWLWNFGDPASGANNTSTLQNPSHIFVGPGNHTVTLTACNGFGCTTETKTNLINAVPGIAMAPINCKPQTISATSNSGIWVVRFGDASSSGIYHLSGPATEGYKDYSCSVYTTIFAYNKIGFSCQTFNPSFIVAWLDFNNDGQFDASEQIFDNMSIPPNAVKGIYLRLRVSSQRANTPITGPCNNVIDGQAQDYGVKILAPPRPDFVHDYACSGTIAFTDSSISNPTSWLWNFNNPASGVNNSSTQQNPSHTFTTPGDYMVSLQVCNSDGCQTIQKKVTIGINPNVSLLPTCRPKGEGHDILRVSMGSINYSTMANPSDQGYKDYSCAANTILMAGNTYPITIETANWVQYNLQTWIDYNSDGLFSSNERVIMSPVSSANFTTNITIPTFAVRNTYLRMRVKLQHNINPITGPCINALPQEFNSQVEDYAVMIVDPVGVNENVLADNIKVYPNPNNGIFTLELPKGLKENCQLEVQDLIGKTVATKLLKVQSSASYHVDLSHLPKGIYLLKLSNEKASAIKKIIIE